MPGFFERFPKFAVVGGLGTLVNLAIVYAMREWALPRELGVMALPIAQLVAIAVATIHNFALNRAWTWRDRRSAATPTRMGDQGHKAEWTQAFSRYAAVACLSMGLQLICVQLLSEYVHYLLAVAIGIVLASAGAFALNDRWAFAEPSATGAKRLGIAALCAACVLAVCSYLFALDSQMIPKNGDENVYLHITRVTAQQGSWLPLQSQLDNMRNTKPPLLFWQGRAILALSDGRWDVALQRLPNVIMSLVCATLIAAVALAMGAGRGTAALAGLLWLGFLSTFRYGRPFLTNAPEVLLLFAPLAVLLLLASRPNWAVWLSSRWVMPLALGFLVGLGLLYKSPALLLPAGLGLVLARGALLGQWKWTNATELLRRFKDGVFWASPMAVLALGLFALWPAWDPEPMAIWREFVVGENWGKMARNDATWLQTFALGPDSICVYLFASAMNPGPLLVVVCAGLVVAWRKKNSSPAELALWLWLAIWLVVFSLPSQRSARYILPAMPAAALLVALHWGRIPDVWIRLNHLCIAALVLLLCGLAWGVRGAAEPSAGADAVTWGLIGLALVSCMAGALRPRAWGLALPVSSLLFYMAMGGAFRPIDRMGFSQAAIHAVQGQSVAVPCNFRAKFEEYRFALAGADIQGYHESLLKQGLTAQALADRHRFYVIRTGFGNPAPVCESCIAIGNRFVIRSRHSNDELKRMVGGQVTEHLIAREWLIDAGENRRSQSADASSQALNAALTLPVNRCL